MKVNEIFYSISGEGIHAGTPTVFVRLQGCNLRCDYCDTKYALSREGGEEMNLVRVVERVDELSLVRHVLITGGEPLLQEVEVCSLVRTLGGRNVEVETNGSIDPPYWFGLVDSWNVDVKCPSSGPSYGSFRTKWLRRMRKRDQLKFVVGTEEDLDFVRGFLNDTKLRPAVLVSPIIPVDGIPEHLMYTSDLWLQRVAEFCKEQNVRLSLQLHKILYGNRRGV